MKKYKTSFCLSLLFLCSFGIAQQKKELTGMQVRQHFNWVVSEMQDANSMNVLVVAHRGDWRNAPENSVQALRNSIAMGVDIMEIDLKMTKDGVLVLLHDKTIDRTMSGKGNPSDYTLDSLKKMTLKSANGCPSTHRIPTFEEFMIEAKGKMFINIDKCYPYYPQVVAVLKRTGTLGQVLMNSEKDLEKNKKEYGAFLHAIPFKPVVDLDKMAIGAVDDYVQFHPKVIELVFSSDTSWYIQHPELFRKNNIKIYVNSMWAALCAGHEDDIAVELHDTKHSWQWLIDHHATIIQTDRPKDLLSYLRTKKLHI